MSADATPLVDGLDPDVELGIADGVAYQLQRALVGDRVGNEAGTGLVDVADREHAQEAAETGLLQPEEPAQARVGDVDDAEVADRAALSSSRRGSRS